MKNIKVKHLFLAIIFLILMTSVNMCTSCQSRNNSKKVINEQDSLISQVISLQEEIIELRLKSIDKVDLEIQGFKTEKRILINTNQIFLTKKRPDERVLEIDKEIEKLEKEKIIYENE